MTNTWTNAETKRLLQYVRRGYSHARIGNLLNRTEKAVELKVRRIKNNTLKTVTLYDLVTTGVFIPVQ